MADWQTMTWQCHVKLIYFKHFINPKRTPPLTVTNCSSSPYEGGAKCSQNWISRKFHDTKNREFGRAHAFSKYPVWLDIPARILWIENSYIMRGLGTKYPPKFWWNAEKCQNHISNVLWRIALLWYNYISINIYLPIVKIMQISFIGAHSCFM